MKICSSKNERIIMKKANKMENNKIVMMGKIIPKVTELKNGKIYNTISLDIKRENPSNLFEETINKLEVYNLNTHNKYLNRTENNLNIYAEQENEIKNKSIYECNNPNNNIDQKFEMIVNDNQKVNEVNQSFIQDKHNYTEFNYNHQNDYSQAPINLNKNKQIIANNKNENYDNNNLSRNQNNNGINNNNNNNNNNKLDNNADYANSNLEGSFGFSRNSALTSNNPPLNLHNRMISDNSNFYLNELADKNNKEIHLEKQTELSGNNIFLNNLIKNPCNNNYNSSSRNDFNKDQRILALLFSVIDSKISLEIFSKFNLNFFDFLNITKEELTEFKVPIKEKIRVLKLNLNLKKFLEENLDEENFEAFAHNSSEPTNLDLIFQFFKQNKFLVYNQKILETFLTDNNNMSMKFEEELDHNNINDKDKNSKYNLNNANAQVVVFDDNDANIDEDKLGSNYITTPNFRNISHRKNHINTNITTASAKDNLVTNSYSNNDISKNTNNLNDNELNYKPTSNVYDNNYNNKEKRNVIYNSNRIPNNIQLAKHEKEIVDLLKKKDFKNNTINAEPAYIAKKKVLIQNNLCDLKNIEKEKNKEVSHYESFRNEYEKIQSLNNNYKNAFSNANSFDVNKVSEYDNDRNSDAFISKNYNNNHNFNSSLKTKNFESNKDNTSFKISNFTIKSRNCLENYNNNSIIKNNNEENENILVQEIDSNSIKEYSIRNNNNCEEKYKKSFYRENQIFDVIQNNQILENHENLQKQRKLLDKLTDNKTKSKIKFKKNSTRYINNSNEISKLVNNYLSEIKELKERSENRQIRFNRLIKNCNRMNYDKITNFNLNKNVYFNEGNITEKTNSDDREEFILNKELNDLLNELQIYSDNFKVSEDNIYKLKRIKDIIDILKAKNNKFEIDLDFNVEELEKQLELEKIEKVEQRKLKITDEINKCNFNINEKKKILDILQEDSVRNKNKSNKLKSRIRQISNSSCTNNISQQSKALTSNNESSNCSEKLNTLNNKVNNNDLKDNYDYENEDLNQHLDQSSYDEYYDSKNYSIHNFNKDI